LGCYVLQTGERTEVPGISLDSSQDLLHIGPIAVIRLTTRLTVGRYNTLFKGNVFLLVLGRVVDPNPHGTALI
jgi:hypothetical protein